MKKIDVAMESLKKNPKQLRLHEVLMLIEGLLEGFEGTAEQIIMQRFCPSTFGLGEPCYGKGNCVECWNELWGG